MTRQAENAARQRAAEREQRVAAIYARGGVTIAQARIHEQKERTR